MIRAVLCATAGGGAAVPLGDSTVLDRLTTQLAAAGIEQVTVLVRPGEADGPRAAGLPVEECADLDEELRTVARLARQTEGRIALCMADLVAADAAVSVVPATARYRGAALVGAVDRTDRHAPVITQRGRVVRVGEPAEANVEFRGLLVAGGAQVAAAVDTVSDVPATAPDVPTVVLEGLVRLGVPVASQRLRGMPYRRVTDAADAAAAAEELREVDEDAVSLRLAVKRKDDLFATYAVSTFSPRLVRWAARCGLTPTEVTWASVGIAALSALAFAHGGRGYLIAGAIGLYLSFVLDCVDGQLARYLRSYSRYGGWLDAIADRGKEYLVYAGLAYGATRSGLDGTWALAIAAMVLLTVRHMTDAWYGTLQDEAVAARARRERTSAAALESFSLRLGAALGQVSDRVLADTTSVAYWVKRTIALPIGERWLLIGLVTAVFDARLALLALLTWGGLAAAYTLLGRVLRSRQLRVPVMRIANVALHRDDGPLARRLARWGRGVLPPLPAALLPALVVAIAWWWELGGAGVAAVLAAAAVAALAGGAPHTGPLDWLVPAALRLAEYATLLLIGQYAGVPGPLLYGLCGVLALYHYDLTARLEFRGSPLRWRALALGWDGRLLLCGLAVLVGAVLSALGDPVPDGRGSGEPLLGGPVSAAMALLTGYLAAGFVAGAVAGAIGARRRTRYAAPRQRVSEPPALAVRHPEGSSR